MRDRNVPPEKWHNYSNIGGLIAGTMFVAFKVPLDERFNYCIHESDRFTPLDLIKCRPDLGLVIDLTNTLRYYNPDAIERMGVKHRKVACPGQLLPTQNLVKRFCAIVDDFRYNCPPEKSVVGVHCTHGVNRSGYMICCYMIRNLGIRPTDALRAFESGRGHSIERCEYISALLDRRIEMPLEAIAGRLARPPKLCQLNEVPEVPSSPESPPSGQRPSGATSNVSPRAAAAAAAIAAVYPRNTSARSNVAPSSTAATPHRSQVSSQSAATGASGDKASMQQSLSAAQSTATNMKHIPSQVPLAYQGRGVHPVPTLPLTPPPPSSPAQPLGKSLSQSNAKPVAQLRSKSPASETPVKTVPPPSQYASATAPREERKTVKKTGKGSGKKKRKGKEGNDGAGEERRTVVRLAMSPRQPWPRAKLYAGSSGTIPTSHDINAVITSSKERTASNTLAAASVDDRSERRDRRDRRPREKPHDKHGSHPRRSSRASAIAAASVNERPIGKAKTPGTLRARSESHGGPARASAAGGVGDAGMATAPAGAKRAGSVRGATVATSRTRMEGRPRMSSVAAAYATTAGASVTSTLSSNVKPRRQPRAKSGRPSRANAKRAPSHKGER